MFSFERLNVFEYHLGGISGLGFVFTIPLLSFSSLSVTM